MRVAIIGAGALGSVLGGLLIEAGLDVVLVQRDKEMVKAVKNNGLRLEGASGDRVIRAEIVNDPSEAGKVDLAITTDFVKDGSVPISLGGYINLAGSRNLEIDPKLVTEAHQ